MPTHAPHNYVCPICLSVKGIENEEKMIKQADIFYRDDQVMALVNSKLIDSNPGHVIVVPLRHYENIYSLPDDVGAAIMTVAKKVAVALKVVRQCDGVMLQQNNEPASGQHAFHFHLHVFPRFTNDHFHEHVLHARVSDPSERKSYARELKTYFTSRLSQTN